MTPEQAAAAIKATVKTVTEETNKLTKRVFRTRGGRLGSGMGLLLEGLWGYETSVHLAVHGLEIAWIADHQYNDFVAVELDADWDPSTGEGELLGIEAKSMNLGADESKAHFDVPIDHIRRDDLLVVITWRWAADGNRVWPQVQEVFIENAIRIVAS